MCNKDQFKFFFFVKLPVFTYYIDKSQVLIMIILFSHLPYSDPPPYPTHIYFLTFAIQHFWIEKRRRKTKQGSIVGQIVFGNDNMYLVTHCGNLQQTSLKIDLGWTHSEIHFIQDCFHKSEGINIPDHLMK